MTRRASKTRWNLIIILIIFGTISYAGYKYFNSQKTPANIFVVTPSAISYGNTTITGVLRKDSPVGESGNYLLILDDSRPVVLDVKGLEHLLGNKVMVSGYLLEATKVRPLFMKVNTITLTQ